MKRISVCGEACVPRCRSNPSSDSRNRRVRQARSDPVSVRDPWPVTRPAASRMRAVSDVKGTHDAAKRKRGDHRPVGRRELGEQPFDRVPEELLASGDERLLIDDEHETAAGRDVVVGAVGRRHASARRRRSAAAAAETRRSVRTARTRSAIRTSTSEDCRSATGEPSASRATKSTVGPAGRSLAICDWRADTRSGASAARAARARRRWRPMREAAGSQSLCQLQLPARGYQLQSAASCQLELEAGSWTADELAS